MYYHFQLQMNLCIAAILLQRKTLVISIVTDLETLLAALRMAY